jgi:malate:Na+ symporter
VSPPTRRCLREYRGFADPGDDVARDAATGKDEEAGHGAATGAWWRWVELRVGIIPLPVYIVLVALLGGCIASGHLTGDISTVIALLVVGGFTCAEIGRHLPYLRQIGAAAIFATFVPSALTYYGWLPRAVIDVTTSFTESTQFLYLFITAIIVGSIFSMAREVLVRGFVRILVPLLVGSIASITVGTATGALLGLGWAHTLFFIVLPIMAGGVGEGAIPLSVGYAQILHGSAGEEFAQVLPPVMLGSLTAILLAGTLNFIGKRRPEWTGEGRLQPGAQDSLELTELRSTGTSDVMHIAAAGITAIALYLAGVTVQRLCGLPAPVAMLFAAVALKLLQAVPPSIERGSFVVYRFFATAVTYPLLFAIGVALTPWDRLLAALHPLNVITIAVTVTTMVASGFLVGRRMGLYPIDTAIVTACHSGQGGTGDVAILTAANRMALMPFAQIATRIGGAITVTLTLVAFAALA